MTITNEMIKAAALAYSKSSGTVSEHFKAALEAAEKVRLDHLSDVTKMVTWEDCPPFTSMYRNWRGEVAERTVRPIKIWYGSTKWHPENQWFLRAFDVDKWAERDFALSGLNVADQKPPVLVDKTTCRAQGGDKASLKREIDYLKRIIAFVATWAWRENDITDHHRLDAIKHLPSIKKFWDEGEVCPDETDALKARIDELEDALKASLPAENGRSGGPLVGAKFYYEDGHTERVCSAPFEKARAALAKKEG